MNIFKKILSYLLISIYALSSAHGAIPHIYDNNHQHEEHNHHSHNHSEHEENPLIQVSHVIFHSVVHFIETLSHCHNTCDELIAVELGSIVPYVHGSTITLSTKDGLIKYSPRGNTLLEKCKFTNLYLINSSLRGPPSIV